MKTFILKDEKSSEYFQKIKASVNVKNTSKYASSTCAYEGVRMYQIPLTHI